MNTGRRLPDKPDTDPLHVFVCMGCWGQAVRKKKKTAVSVASKTRGRVAAVIELNPCGLFELNYRPVGLVRLAAMS